MGKRRVVDPSPFDTDDPLSWTRNEDVADPPPAATTQPSIKKPLAAATSVLPAKGKAAKSPAKGKAAKGRAAAQGVQKRLHMPADSILDHETFQQDNVSKAVVKNWGETHEERRDAFAGVLLQQARLKMGGQLFLGTQMHALTCVIPVPALAFEYVIATDGFPLGLLFELNAVTGVGKSGILAEFCRWFDMIGGMASVVEAELKLNPKWYEAILQDAFRRLFLYKAHTVEAWQRTTSNLIRYYKAQCVGSKKLPGIGKTMPHLFGVDSISGQLSEETLSKIFGETSKHSGLRGGGTGSANRAHPVEALKNTAYVKAVPSEITEWPIGLVFVNQVKYKKSQDKEERSKGGGQQISFVDSIELELSRPPIRPFATAEFEGYYVDLHCYKNSLGPGGRKIRTRCLSVDRERDSATGTWSERVVWDWNWSLIWLMDHHLNSDYGNAHYKASLRDCGVHLQIKAGGDIENRAWSTSVGMKDETEAVPWSQLGAMFQEDREIVNALRAALRIHRRPKVVGGVDMDAVVAELMKVQP